MKRRGYDLVAARRIEIRALINAAKSNPCVDCKERFHAYVMDFDHVRGKKFFNLSAATRNGMALNKVKAEIVKCDVVCSNCHRIRTGIRLGIMGG